MSKTIECRASRHGEMWVASIPQHAVYGYGRTLKALHDNITHGLALVEVTAHVTITPISPELDRLRRAEAAYEAALADAVTTLAAHGSTARDIAEATGVPIARVTAIQTKPATPRTRTSRKRNASPAHRPGHGKQQTRHGSSDTH